jgi:hypothetical protein
MARQLLVDLRRLDRALAHNRVRCAAAVAACGTTLTTVFGISDVLVARSSGTPETSAASPQRTASRATRGRLPSKHRAARSPAIACLGTGTAPEQRPAPCRSGPDHAPGPGREHYERKLARHKSSGEALRSLKRQLAKVVYRHLVANRTRWSRPFLT